MECRQCGDEVDELVTATVGGKRKKVCADCAERAAEESEVAAEAERVVQGMMEYKGRR